MNEEDYIKSGILQDYCLGLLSDEAERNVEVMCNAYPKLACELQSLRLALENMPEAIKCGAGPNCAGPYGKP